MRGLKMRLEVFNDTGDEKFSSREEMDRYADKLEKVLFDFDNDVWIEVERVYETRWDECSERGRASQLGDRQFTSANKQSVAQG
jgi:hypothetical protein